MSEAIHILLTEVLRINSKIDWCILAVGLKMSQEFVTECTGFETHCSREESNGKDNLSGGSVAIFEDLSSLTVIIPVIAKNSPL